MRGVMLDIPPALLAERARLGHDRFDEMWEGELHMVPPPSMDHQWIGSELHVALRAAAIGSGLLVTYETGLFDPEVVDGSSYRQPDLVVFGPDVRSERGVEGAAELVVEIVSPGDESLAKLPFYGHVGVREVLLIDRDTRELRRWVRRGEVLAEVLSSLPITLRALPVGLEVVEGHLHVTSPAGVTII